MYTGLNNLLEVNLFAWQTMIIFFSSVMLMMGILYGFNPGKSVFLIRIFPPSQEEIDQVPKTKGKKIDKDIEELEADMKNATEETKGLLISNPFVNTGV